MKMYLIIALLVFLVSFVYSKFIRKSKRPFVGSLISAGIACLLTFLVITSITWLFGILAVCAALYCLYWLIILRKSINEEDEE